MMHNSYFFGNLMFIHFFMYDVLKYFKICNKFSLIIKVHVNVFVSMNDYMYDEFFCAYKYYT
jgi:hypothetical protein